MRYVYIIKSAKLRYKYTGSTNDIDRRMAEHNKGICKASDPYKPFKLISYIAVENKDKAIKLERYLKTGSGLAFLNKRII